jgi:uncharacterized protein YeaO (DUF488 family)
VAIHLKRAYDPPKRADGVRVLVDRLWPRGLSKERAHIDHWLREIAPSTALRKWFNHDPKKWESFRKRYVRELESNVEALDQLRKLARRGQVTLIYAAQDEKHNQAAVLRDFLTTRRKRTSGKPRR